MTLAWEPGTQPVAVPLPGRGASRGRGRAQAEGGRQAGYVYHH